ncbi:MAG TPA: glycosyltransferase family 39 protein, partial [Thermoanaerobaculia bacterium]|nr:glycosyltransferase family 39 protein [Thermoanaerobaculia bacterium]
MIDRRWTALLAALVVFTAARVMTTHRVFNQTSDEPFHVAAGYDLLTKGSYALDPEHPPLARVFFALPFLDTPDPAATEPTARGNALLFRNERYTQNLGRARLGNLLFLAIGIVGVALWARHLFTPATGLIAALLYASLPPVLAHGGFATTDMAGAAMFTLAMYALTLLLEEPTWKRALLLGLAVGAGCLAKFSFVLYFPAAALLLVVARRRFPLRRLLVAAGLAFVMVWAAYGFTFGTLQDTEPRSSEMAGHVFGSTWIATEAPMPMPRYVSGLLIVKNHDHFGHPAFLFDVKKWEGWWYYFPLALFFKTPIPFLLLAIAGCALLVSGAAGFQPAESSRPG